MSLYSQIPGYLDLSGVIGDDWSMALDWDISLSGYTWEAAVVDQTGTSVATITVTVNNASTGLMTLSIADNLTDLLNEKAYRWYLKQTNAGLERIWLAGFFRWYKKSAARFGTSNGTAVSVSVFSGTTVSVSVSSAQGPAGADGASPIGKQVMWVPSVAMVPTWSNGCASIKFVETTAGQPDLQVLDFDASADEHAQFQIAMPNQWDEGTVTFQVYWTTAATDTDGVAWGLQGVAISDNEAIATAYGTPVVVTDDAQSAANELLVSAESSAVTIAGTPAAGDLCCFRFFRDVSDANDDMTEDARLIGIKLYWTQAAVAEA